MEKVTHSQQDLSHNSKLEYLPRRLDVISNANDLEHVFSLVDFPVFLGCTDEPIDKDIKAEMSFSISKKSGCVQLDKLIPLHILYAENHATVVGELWESHHKNFAEFLKDLNPNNVLEIGGAHGMLCKNFQSINPSINWTIIEPNPIPVENIKAKYIRAFFDDSFITNENFDMVVHSHTLEHSYNPQKFISDISKYLSKGNFHCFSVPNIEEWLKRKYTNALNFEHTYLLNDFYIENLLTSNGFKIIKKQEFGDKHSTFYAAVKSEAIVDKKDNYPIAMYENNLNLINTYKDYLADEVSKINNELSQLKAPVYLFGAHVFSQTLICLGLDTKNIKFLLDNSEAKIGKRLYGTNLLVQSPKILKDEKNPTVIIRAGAYQNEIIDGIRKLHNSNTKFI